MAAMADCLGSQRLGLLVRADLATVPAFAPIGGCASWYQRHLGVPVADPFDHPSPMVEVLAHHRDRWGHIDSMDRFWSLLTFDEFHADDWARLAQDSGASSSVMVAKHHDGLCWWDAPGTARTVVHDGPRRDVLAEFASACHREGLVFGAAYSLLDWSAPRHPAGEQLLGQHLFDLVERYGAQVLWGDAAAGDTDGIAWAKDVMARLRASHPDVAVNDGWGLAEPDLVTFHHLPPVQPPECPWVLSRELGRGVGYNRAERREHLLDGVGIVSLFTEVVAKGGALLLSVCPAADGTIPQVQSEPLRVAGAWIRSHAQLVASSRAWHVWGDDSVRYLQVPAAPNEGRERREFAVVAAIDLAGRGEFAALGRAAVDVLAVEAVDGTPLEWEHDGEGLRVRRTDRSPVGLAAVYRVVAEPVTASAIELFPPSDPVPIDISESIAAANPGDVLQLGDGRYRGPIAVPAGVTIRGAGPDRTRIAAPAEGPALTLERGARVEHVAVIGTASDGPVRGVGVVLAGADAVLLGCRLDGNVAVRADGVKVRACQLPGVVAQGVSRLAVSRCRFEGNRSDIGIDIIGGFGHLVESCEFAGHRCAIRFTDTLESTARGNRIDARWWGIRLVGSEASHVVANSIADTMRAVDVDGGTFALVDANAVADGDSGCVVQRGASGTVVSGNHWERCRIGLLAWDASDVTHHDNAAVDLHEPDHAVVIGP